MTEPNRPEWGPVEPHAAAENTESGAPVGPYTSPAAYSYQPLPPEEPNASTSMIVGVLGLVLGFMACGLGFIASPFALVMGLRSRRVIDASGGKLGGRGNAQAGFITGVIGTVMLVLSVLMVAALIVFFVILGLSADSSWFDDSASYARAA